MIQKKAKLLSLCTFILFMYLYAQTISTQSPVEIPRYFQFGTGEIPVRCETLQGDQVFRKGNYPDARSIRDNSSSPNQIRFNDLSSPLQCLEDIQSARQKGEPLWPNPYSSELRIPFYILPDNLPDDSVSWSQCWSEYMDQNINHHHNKRTWGLHVAEQLENHPWRVDNPEDAFVFLESWMDHLQHTPKREACKKVFGGKKPEDGLYEEHGQKYATYLTSTNRLAFGGDFYSYVPWFEKNFSNGHFLKEHYAKHCKTDKDQKRDDDYLACPVTSFFARDMRMMRKHPRSIFNQINVAPLCFLGEDRSESLICKEIEDRANIEISLHEWRHNRPINMTGLYAYDTRPAYKSRRSVSSAIQWMAQNNTDSEKMSLWLERADPFIWLEYNKKSDKGNIQDRHNVCLNEKMGFLDDKKIPDAISGEDVDHTTILSLAKGRTVKDLMNYEDQMRLFMRSKLNISLRGDTPNSQRDSFGMYFRLLTLFEQSEENYAFFSPGPGHLPWRIMAIFDNNQCIKNASNQLIKTSNRKEFDANDARRIMELNDKTVWSDEDMDHWAEDLLKCFKPAFDFLDHDELLKAMIDAITKYRKYALYEVRDSKAAEMMIVEMARMSIKDGRREEDLNRLGMNRSHFEPRVPRSCLLSGGNGVYESFFHSKACSEEQHELIKGILEEDDVLDESWLEYIIRVYL